MLYQHINYYQYHTNDFYLNSYFINLTITFVDIAIKNYIKSLISKHLNTSSSFSKLKLPKIDLNVKETNKNKDDKALFIDKDIIQSIFKLSTVMDKFPNIKNHSYKIFHFFIQILPFIKYSNENIDKNGEFFSTLFKIDFEQLTQKVNEKLKSKENEENDDNDITMKEEKKDDHEDDDNDDDDDDDEMKT